MLIFNACYNINYFYTYRIEKKKEIKYTQAVFSRTQNPGHGSFLEQNNILNEILEAIREESEKQINKKLSSR